jgi:hypothetical protein
MDLPAFVKQIQSLIYDIVVKVNELETEDRIIIEYGMSILLNVLLYDEESQKRFVTNGNNEMFLIEGLFTGKSINVRKYFSVVFYLLAKRKKEVKYFLKIHFVYFKKDQVLIKNDFIF